MKFRIIEKSGRYYPQFKELFWWANCYHSPSDSYYLLEEAKRAMDSYIRRNTYRIVWESTPKPSILERLFK